MKSVARILFLVPCLALGSAFVMADPHPPVTMEVGPALADGVVAFTLNSSDGGNSTLSLQVNVAQGDSPSAVAAKIVAAVGPYYSSWSGQASGGALTFSHFNGSSWSSVSYITGLSNTAGCTMYLSADVTSGAQWGGISMVLNSNASGKIIGIGGPMGSTITFRINGITAPYTVNLTPSMTTASIMSGLAAYLNGLSDFGSYVVVSPTALTIILGTDHAAFTFQTNDTGLQGAMVVGELAGSIGNDGSNGGDKHQGGQPPL